MIANRFPWYIPSLFGDIELTPDPDGTADDQRTILRYEKLSNAERIALEALIADKWQRVGGVALAKNGRGKMLLQMELDIAREDLIETLKVGATLSAVRFANGEIIETTATEALAIAEEKKTKPTAGASVAKPTVGCPAPEFDAADVRATRVLRAFLTEQQRTDWDKHNRFIVEGADTGHRYLVISRHSMRRPSLRQGRERLHMGPLHELSTDRSVYDLDEKRSICVHDWSVPAAEECLALMLHLVTPGNENYARDLAA